MSSVFGQKIIYSLFGESHSDYVGITINNLPSGIKLDKEYIDQELKRRRPSGKISSPRIEQDKYKIISGFMNEKTTGAPLTILVDNENTVSKDYNQYIPRPSHSDYPAYIKYKGYNDYKGGGHFSGRMTVALVIAGAIIQGLLMEKGITIGTHIYSIGDFKDQNYENPNPQNLEQLHKTSFPTFSKPIETQMQKLIEEVKEKGDSVGGILQTFVLGMPVGIGEPFFDSVESILSHLIFSIPAVKGLNFGSGIDFAKGYGSNLNDEIYIEEDKIYTKTNHNGGINGGLSNAMAITFKTIVKPTPSIYLPQNTIHLQNKKQLNLSIKGRHDPCIVHRIAPVIDAMTAIGIYELLGE